MKSYSRLLPLVLGCAAGVAAAQDQEPDVSFLEYLGSWEEGDEEWVIVAELEDDIEDDGENEDGAAEPDEKDDAREDN